MILIISKSLTKAKMEIIEMLKFEMQLFAQFLSFQLAT
jgi:hypothetical protein